MSDFSCDYYSYTDHAKKRMNQRGISESAVEFALSFGRKVRSRGACFFVVGRKQVKGGGIQSNTKAFENVHVLVDELSGKVLTVYKNKELRRVRPFKRAHRHLH